MFGAMSVSLNFSLSRVRLRLSLSSDVRVQGNPPKMGPKRLQWIRPLHLQHIHCLRERLTRGLDTDHVQNSGYI